MNTNEYKEYLASMVNYVECGDSNPLKVYLELKELSKDIEKALSKVSEYAINEAEKYGKGQFEFHGYKVALRSAASRWDFKKCEPWIKAKNDLSKIEELAKLSYKLKQSGGTAITEDAEVIEGAVYIEGKTTLFVEQIKR